MYIVITWKRLNPLWFRKTHTTNLFSEGNVCLEIMFAFVFIDSIFLYRDDFNGSIGSENAGSKQVH